LKLTSKKTWALSLCAGFFVGAAAGGCGLLDIPITLQTQSFMQNFGNSTGTVPPVQCTIAGDPSCNTVTTQVNTAVASSGATVPPSCDMSVNPNLCVAQLDATFSYPVTLSKDQSFTTAVAGKAVAVVKSISLKYGIPTNSLTFNIPELDLYIAPQGVT